MVASIEDIQTSVKAGGTLIKDEFIRRGSPQKTLMGRLIHYSGGFSVVFPFTVNGEKWAFRCWHSDVSMEAERFALLSQLLTKYKKKVQCFDDFIYEKDGIVVNGHVMPTTRMRWVVGENLKDYIVSHKKDTKALQTLANNFKSTVESLHEIGASHGDLQHGNIIVDKDGGIHLIDYDSLYFPEMKGKYDGDVIKGKPEYQHPARVKARKTNEKTDYFSELVIYLSIVAIAQDPSLIDSYNVEDSDCLLFDQNDYKSFANSKVYKDLSSREGVVPVLLNILSKYLLAKDIDSLRPFPELFAEMTTPPVIESFEAERRFSFPGVPVKLSWSVSGNFEEVYLSPPKHKVYLSPSKRKVSAKGEEFVEPNKDVRYKLEAVGLAGSVTKSLQIRMLPLPVIQSIKVPTPEMKSIANVSISMPRFPVESISLPRFVATPSLKMETPKSIDVSRLSAAINKGIKSVKLNPPLPSFWQDLGNVLKRHTRRYTSLWTDLKNYLKRNNDGK